MTKSPSWIIAWIAVERVAADAKVVAGPTAEDAGGAALETAPSPDTKPKRGGTPEEAEVAAEAATWESE
jgi:hypothetical protein